MGVCTSAGKGAQSVSRETSSGKGAQSVSRKTSSGKQSVSSETTRSLMSSWNSLNQRGTNLSAYERKKRNSIGKELLKRAVDGSSNSAYYEKHAGGSSYDVNLGPNNPSYRLSNNVVAVTSEIDGMLSEINQFKNPAEAVKFVDSEIKRIKGNRK